ncbi:MAG: GNAT family N-acetyltransferase [Actinomycetota bacterium]|nr:GNAT family N-acetyltransferase [Actinomycetota bacterium]
MSITIRPATTDELPAVFGALVRGFGFDPDEDDPNGSSLWALLPAERTAIAFDGDRMVGTLGEYDLHVAVPGGARLSMAGTTIITVAASHRRRGVLRSMMADHLDTVAGRGDPIAGLWASEAAIYGRFGYGCAADGVDYTLPGSQVVIAPPPDIAIEIIDSGAALDVLPAIYDRVAGRPGMLERTSARWEHEMLRDPPSRREGKSALRHAVATRSGEGVGYVTYRQKQEWERVPEGTVNVEQLLAADTPVRRALVWFVAHLDLFPNVKMWNQPVDDPLVWEVADRRQLVREVSDTLWIRIMDVPSALTARSYETDGTIVMGITDPTRPSNSGAYRLDITDGSAVCSPTDEEAAVTMDIRELGALYLGGRSAVTLQRAGLIAGTRPAVAHLDRLFRTAAAPWCPEVF